MEDRQFAEELRRAIKAYGRGMPERKYEVLMEFGMAVCEVTGAEDLILTDWTPGTEGSAT